MTEGTELASIASDFCGSPLGVGLAVFSAIVLVLMGIDATWRGRRQ